MGKILCYVYEEMADFEITLLLHRLRGAGGREIVSISEDTGPITAQSGLQFLPDRRIQEIDSLEDVEALILPAHRHRYSMQRRKPLHQLLSQLQG